MLKTFFEFDCTNDKMLIYEGTRRPDFLNIGRYSVNVIEKLLEIRVQDSVDISFIDDR